MKKYKSGYPRNAPRQKCHVGPSDTQGKRAIAGPTSVPKSRVRKNKS